MRINKFQKQVIASNENVTDLHKKINLSQLFVTIMEAVSQYGIIIFYLLEVEWNSISLATITEITATLLIVETALGQIRSIADTLDNLAFKDFVASLHISEVEVCHHIGEECEESIAHSVPKVEYTM